MRPFRQPLFTRRVLAALAALTALLVGGSTWVWATMIRMPGRTYRGPLPALEPREQEIARELRRDVEMLATQIGDRNYFRRIELLEAADWLASSMQLAGRTPTRQSFEVRGQSFENIELEVGARTPAEGGG